MTKAEAQKLGNQIIDYFQRLAGDIQRQNIVLNVCDTWSVDDNEAECETDTQSKIFKINLYICEGKDFDYVETAICHELAHVYGWEMKFLFDTYIGSEEEEIASKIFDHLYEQAAYRLENVLLECWRLSKKGRK